VQKPLHQILAEQEAKVADLRKKLEREEAVLDGMRLVADATPARNEFFHGALSATPHSGLAEATKNALRRGRQPGAISREWRDTLRFLYARCPYGFSIDQVVGAAHTFNLPNVKDRDAEERMRAYLQNGYVEKSEVGYRVSESAALKYGFDRSETTEAPTANAEGAS
jgi:hypothetical protein